MVALVDSLQRPVQPGEFLLGSLALDALRDSISHHLEGLDSVLTQKFAREHRQDTNQATFDYEGVARKGNHSLLFRPLGIAYMFVV